MRPLLVVYGHYNTVRHGELEYFALHVPETAELIERPPYIIVRMGRKVWGFKFGDDPVPAYPLRARELQGPELAEALRQLELEA
jgi:hypothetical protein